MDNEIFKQFVSKYYTIKQPEPEYLYDLKQRKKIAEKIKDLTRDDQWEEDSEVVELVNELQQALMPVVNTTMPLEIIEPVPHMQPCEDCGNIVSNRKTKKALYSFPIKHWRETCTGCRMARHPETGEFSIPNPQVQFFFTSYLRVKDK